jgi:hypothetical protein
MTRAYNTATTQQNTGGAVAGVTAGKNAVINGGFDIWQRCTSVSALASANTWTADRWALSTFANCASTISRQLTNDTTNLPNIQYCARFQRNSGQTGTNGFYITQAFETVNAIPYAGKTVTMSFYARAGANYSPTSNVLKVYLLTGTGTDQPRAGVSYTGELSPINTTATLTTTWQRFSFTGTIATNVTEFSPTFEATHTGTAGAADYFEVTGVQVEVGSVATPFSRNAGTIQGELAACQRYYYRVTPSVTNGAFSVGNNYSTTINTSVIYPKVTLRTTPTLETSGTASNYRVNTAGTGFTCSAVPVIDQTSTDIIALNATVASGLTVGNAGILIAISGGTSILAFSSEL